MYVPYSTKYRTFGQHLNIDFVRLDFIYENKS